MQPAHDLFNPGIELKFEAGDRTIHFGQDLRELGKSLGRQPRCVVGGMTGDHFPKYGDSVKFWISLTACMELFFHSVKVQLFYRIRVQKYPLIRKKIADYPVDFVIRFISMDVYQGAVYIENYSTNIHCQLHRQA